MVLTVQVGGRQVLVLIFGDLLELGTVSLPTLSRWEDAANPSILAAFSAAQVAGVI